MTEQKRDYRDTLFLPKTDFPMRAGLPKKEPEWLEFWNRIGLYERLREQSKGREPYCLHDGPPYANGHIHMGTALNKTHKDIVNRSHQMLGLDANYVPGWDCHGLPIEWKVEEEFRGKGRSKDDVAPSEFRARCRDYAQGWVDIQSAEFQRLGVVGDWKNPYLTMRPESEAIICEELLKIAASGQLYRGSKPIMWSPVEQTALAEAEVEYKDRKATQIYVKFPVKDLRYSDEYLANEIRTMHVTPKIPEGLARDEISDFLDNWKIEDEERRGNPSKKTLDLLRGVFEKRTSNLVNASIVIWTTTPWTIPANRAVSFSTKIQYGIYQVTEMEESDFEPWSKAGDKLIVADDLWPSVAKAGLIKSAERLSDVSERSLTNIILNHPLKDMKEEDGAVNTVYDFPVPLLEGDHVTAEAGTGFVHTAPSHGEDDYGVWISNQQKLESLGIDPVVPMTLDDAGCYTDVMPTRFQGLDVIRTSGKKRGQDGKANPEVLKALVECGNLLARGMLTLRDAHSWRSKAPVIRRATPQWFISMSKDGLRDKAMAAIEKTDFWPARGKNRLGTMVADRPDWLISRQRNWGVPITLLVGPNGELHTDRDDAEAINARILAAVRKDGVDGWFDTPLTELMPPKNKGDNEGWTKVTDILDVWFDSGCTHAFCLKQRDDLPDIADLYLEGSDQHRGWFQSSLLQSCAIYGEAPYKGVLTDGFVVDEKGLKMSKSLGNTMSPEDINKQYGAEILRIWVASSETTTDLKIGREIIQTNVDAYRKLRNTLRYMIGALDGFDAGDAVDYADMPALEKWVLHRLAEITADHGKWVRDHDHKRIFSTLFQFCTVDLSAFYFDIRKDALYCDPLNSTRRRACRTVMHYIFERLVTWLAPYMCFTMEEVWQTRFPSEDKSVHMELFREAPEEWLNLDVAHNMDRVRDFRSVISEVIEPKRKEGEIKSSLEARVEAMVDKADYQAIQNLNINLANAYSNSSDPDDLLADYLIVSECEVTNVVEIQPVEVAGKISEGKHTAFAIINLKEVAGYAKCERSWKYFEGEGEITERDAAAVAAFEAG